MTLSNNKSIFATIGKSNQEIAMMMMMRPAKTAAGKAVQAKVLAQVEIAIAIEECLKAA